LSDDEIRYCDDRRFNCKEFFPIVPQTHPNPFVPVPAALSRTSPFDAVTDFTSIPIQTANQTYIGAVLLDYTIGGERVQNIKIEDFLNAKIEFLGTLVNAQGEVGEGAWFSADIYIAHIWQVWMEFANISGV
jgi:hypothetical protein